MTDVQSAIRNPQSAIRVVVIGGGIAGLAAAHRLVELRHEKGLPLEVVLLEASDRLGGNIATRNVDGFLVEEGPDSFITQKPWALALCRRIGLMERLIQTNEGHRRTFVVHRGRLHPVPEGFLMLAPTKFMPLVTSSLFSWRGKMRMALDLVLPRGKAQEDESLASFVTRRLGREAFERVAQPLVSGVYTADPHNLSLRATMPRFLQMEEKHGSIIKAMLHEQRAAAQRQRVNGSMGQRGTDSGARYSMFVSFDSGLQTLVDALASRLPAGAARVNQRVAQITPALAMADLTPQSATRNPQWRVTLDGGARLDADGVIIAAPAHRAAALMENFDAALAAQLSAIEYASSAVVNVAYRESDVPRPLDGFGFVVPAIEKRGIIACSFSSVKFVGRAPKGCVLLRCFLGGAIHPQAYEWDDGEMAAAVRREMRELLGVEAAPLFTLVHRHPKSMPQYPVGHLQRVAQIKGLLAQHPGLALAGNAYSGVGIPDCVHTGEEAVESLFSVFNLKPV